MCDLNCPALKLQWIKKIKEIDTPFSTSQINKLNVQTALCFDTLNGYPQMSR